MTDNTRTEQPRPEALSLRGALNYLRTNFNVHMGVDTARRLLRSGKIAGVRVGTSWITSPAALDAFAGRTAPRGTLRLPGEVIAVVERMVGRRVCRRVVQGWVDIGLLIDGVRQRLAVTHQIGKARFTTEAELLRFARAAKAVRGRRGHPSVFASFEEAL